MQPDVKLSARGLQSRDYLAADTTRSGGREEEDDAASASDGSDAEAEDVGDDSEAAAR